MVKKERTKKRISKIRLNCDLSDPELKRRPKEGHGFIYRYIFKNGMSYIGQTINSISTRTRNHRYHGMLVDRIIRSGMSFVVEVLSEPEVRYIDQAEIYCISKFNTVYPNGYNQTHGGQEYHTASDDFRKRMSQKMKERFKDPIVKERFTRYLLERAHEVAPKTPVICLEKNKKYNTMADALRDVGRNTNASSQIIAAIRYEEQYKAYGYHWLSYTKHNMEYAQEFLDAMIQYEKEIYPINHKMHVERMKKIGGKHVVLIRCIHLETGKVYDSFKEASLELGLNYESVVGYATGRNRTLKGNNHIIRYEEWMDDSIDEILNCLIEWEKVMNEFNDKRKRNGYFKKAIRILCLETGQVYNSYNDAMKNVSGLSIENIRRCISGEYNKAKGYHWIIYNKDYLNIKEEIIKILDAWSSLKKSIGMKKRYRKTVSL